MRRWAAPVALAAVALTGTVVAATAGDEASASGLPAAGTAVLTPRRVPMVLARAIADVRLGTTLDALLGDPALGGAREQSCLTVSHDGRDVYRRRPDVPLLPASNLKVLTGAAVLAQLGPHHRFATEARLDGGTLWLVGGGDPLLSTGDYLEWQRRVLPERAARLVYTRFEDLADRIAAAGIREITGGIRGDESRYDDQRYIPSWKRGYITAAEVGPQSALVVNDGWVQFTPTHVAAPSPAKHAADMLATLLQGRGVTVTGGTGEGRVPAGARPVASVESPPAREVVGEMLRESDNLTAELLVKELGVRAGRGGTTAAGLAALRETLANAGLPMDHVAAADGSGLDRGDRATCAVLLAALERAGPGSDLAAGLPVAGQEGTLARRFAGTPAAGRLRAKTGALAGVVGLTGFVEVPAQSPLAFALLANDLPRDAVGRQLQEAVGAALARYPEAPAPESLAP